VYWQKLYTLYCLFYLLTFLLWISIIFVLLKQHCMMSAFFLHHCYSVCCFIQSFCLFSPALQQSFKKHMQCHMSNMWSLNCEVVLCLILASTFSQYQHSHCPASLICYWLWPHVSITVDLSLLGDLASETKAVERILCRWRNGRVGKYASCFICCIVRDCMCTLVELIY